MKNKKILVIIPLLIIVFVCVYILFNSKKDDEIILFYLNGNINSTIEYGSNYLEEGFVAKTTLNKDLYDRVIVTGNINPYVIGKQQISYTLDYENYHNTLVRYVEVVDNLKDYACKVVKKNIGYQLEVTPNESNDNYIWDIDGKIINEKNFVYKDNLLNVKVTITKENGSKKTIDCNISDEMIYHFQYDENNQKEFMKCNTYNASDKVRLEELMRKAILEAGYGTRAGVVEAARFLVGGLDYKVPYLGPKKVDSSLGKYEKVGLNIGSNGWGCMVSGWIQGIDCTNFIKWAFAQNGLSVTPYNESNTFKVREVLNKVKVGDFLLTPCQDSCYASFQHIGIIIGIDDNYIYVAEAATGNINAVVVSKYEKNNMPSKGNFSIVKLYNYQDEGNITNMWIK